MATAEERKKMLKFSKKELIKLCKQQGVSSTGTKTELIERLLKPKIKPKSSAKKAKKKKQAKAKKKIKKLKKNQNGD